jgi:hypothetical protein
MSQQHPSSNAEIQYKRLQDLITALRYQESLERIPVSKASELLIIYARDCSDPLIGGEDRTSASVGINPFVKQSSKKKRFLCF